jgi:hypothetical protein
VSVSRAGLTAAADLLARLGDPATGSRIAAASIADIRALGLDVLPDPLDEDPGHAEIRSATANLGAKDVQRRLSRLFRYMV